jgi:predicted lipase
MELKSFYTSKKMISKLKRQLTEWEKIFAIYTSDKGLIIRTYMDLRKLNSPKNQWPNKEMGNWAEQNFSNEKVQKTKKYMKKCSPSLAIKEMQIKITLRFHLTPGRVATIKSMTNNKCWENVGEKYPSYTVGGNVS